MSRAAGREIQRTIRSKAGFMTAAALFYPLVLPPEGPVRMDIPQKVSELRDSLGVAPGVGIALVHGSGEARRGPEAGRPVGTAREVLELCQLDHIGPRGADAVLPVLLGPVERTVGKPDQLVAT